MLEKDEERATHSSVNGESFSSNRSKSVSDGDLISVGDRDDLVVLRVASVVEKELVGREEGVGVDSFGELK